MSFIVQGIVLAAYFFCIIIKKHFKHSEKFIYIKLQTYGFKCLMCFKPLGC